MTLDSEFMILRRTWLLRGRYFLDSMIKDNSASKELFNLIAEEQTIEQVLNLGEDLFGASMIFTNILKNYSVSSKGFADEVPWTSALSSDIDINSSNYKNFSTLLDRAKDSTPFLVPMDEKTTIMISKIYYKETFIGYLQVASSKKSMDSHHRELLKKIGQTCAIIDLLGDSVSPVEDSSRDENIIFERLLNQRYKTISDFNFVAKNYSFKNYSQFYVLCVNLPAGSSETRENELIRQRDHYHVGLWYKVSRSQIIIMIGLKPSSTSFSVLLEEMKSKVDGKNISIGISDPFTHVLATHNCYQDAKAILRQGMISHPHKSIHLFDDYKFMTYLKDVNHFIQSPNSYISYKVMNILTYDKLNNTDYATTLKTYLSASLSPQLTSEILFIHKNTVIYRINKMKELFDLDFSDADQVFQLYFSFQLLVTRGWREHSK